MMVGDDLVQEVARHSRVLVAAGDVEGSDPLVVGVVKVASGPQDPFHLRGVFEGGEGGSWLVCGLCVWLAFMEFVCALRL